MSLYNEAGRRGRRLTIGAAVAALVVGAAGGFAAGRSSAGDSSAADVVAQLRAELAPARSGLELVPTEYAQVRGGAGSEGAAVDGDLGRIRSGLRAASPNLRALDPAGLSALNAAVKALDAAVAARAPAQEVSRLAAAASAALRRVTGGR